jgi:hypothetical protein
VGEAIKDAIDVLRFSGSPVDAGHWQGIPTIGKPDLETREIMNLQFSAPMPRTPDHAQKVICPNLPWAEDHFRERVSRHPLNPGEEYKNWPWWRGQVDETQEQGKFTHTYMERFWPQEAGNGHWCEGGDHVNGPMGIRYRYGDLDDVVKLLFEHPYTRQATFPIFFPEDTGAAHGGRIPCTLHYHFMLRDNQLHLWYPIRSCDAVRHFRDDLYMAVRLCQWVIDQLFERELRTCRPQLWVDVKPGFLHFTAYSFHVHMGDWHLL